MRVLAQYSCEETHEFRVFEYRVCFYLLPSSSQWKKTTASLENVYKIMMIEKLWPKELSETYVWMNVNSYYEFLFHN